ncbi:hypothetical protein CTAYLR_009777 [Chrysophaeum taylorii]|uniref:WW domain-containing protein n=1 Tax=Chrysophaeum taylorii TaxID=2483200 RepID=A0AAD7UGS4_9STRA|nr:hypothetical protein CTAYLR_009777 [Chrysophaeum taylorii]
MGVQKQAALPAGWTAHEDPASGTTYYWNAALGATSWERPTPSEEEATNPSHAAFLAQGTKDSTAEYAKLLGPSASQQTKWVKHSDPDSGVPYFFNSDTNETQWDVPAEGFIDATVFGTTASTQNVEDPYASTASFGVRTGQFTSGEGATYWDTVGRPNDREGRMMSHYFDLSTLEQNRKEAEEKKKKLKKYDWRKYKEIKKKERTKRRVQALLKD